MTRTTAPRRARTLGVAAAVLALLGGFLTATPAVAATTATGPMPAFVQPVSGYVADLVTGCPAGSRPTHTGVDINQNKGNPIYAAASGTVSYTYNTAAKTSYGTYVVIDHGYGYTTLYAHMVVNSIAVKVGQYVTAGTRIGTVGTTGNSTGEHLHFEIKDGGTPIANSVFRCGQGRVTALTAIPGPTEPATDLGITYALSSTGVLSSRSGVNGPVTNLRTGVASFDVDGARTAVVDTAGNAYVRASAASAWEFASASVKAIALDGERVVILKRNGVVSAKERLSAGSWRILSTGGTAIDADAGRVAAILNGKLYVKSGTLTSAWSMLMARAKSVSVSNDRIAVVQDNRALIKQGPLTAAWLSQGSAVAVTVSGTRTATTSVNGVVRVREGAISSSARVISSPGVTSVALSGNRIAVVSSGQVHLKIGAPTAGWNKKILVGRKSVGLS